MAQEGTRAAGFALVGSAAVTLLAMSHHPTSAHAAAAGRIVHGVLIAMAAPAAYGFLHWSRIRGLGRPAVAAGLVTYMVALFGHVGAALINGFVVTALAHEGGAAGDVHPLAWEANQALAGLGVFATGTAYVLWSLDLLRRGGGWERLVGATGLLLGQVPPALLGVGLLRMNLHGATIIYGAEMLWMALVGLLMLATARRAVS